MTGRLMTGQLVASVTVAPYTWVQDRIVLMGGKDR